MSRLDVVLTLRCPQRCLLGKVVATPDGLRVALRERQVLQRSLDRAEAVQREHGPWSLDDLDLLSVGCRHLTGEPLADYAEAIRTRATTPTTRRAEFVVGPVWIR